ncbi:MAG TPA: DNA primase [Candidatus Limnocylindria bacterium]|nr:DNA primase [Candidatus Limnocylindria bacterium]
MSAGIPAEIKARLPVVEIVGETVTLKRAGAAYKGLCPFHAEKTPSFVVTPGRESWHCFGCGEGGDIFSFVMRRDGVDFREALTRLADRAGVELSERSAAEDRRRRRLREAMAAAVGWYRDVLVRAPQAERARGYLAERGLTAETLERFGIGYAPNTWDALTRRLRARGFEDDELVTAGLATRGSRGAYDRFRGRIIFPIRDAAGGPIGLGGRILPGADGPKYLNTPATPLFDKSRVLFGLDLAAAEIRREGLAVIVEGYTDVMAAHQAGFRNVVASLGTALTRGQVELANRYAEGIALAYDVDLAGEAATRRGLLEELGPDTAVSKVRVVRVPAGKDPDELIRTDPDAWRRAVAEAKPVIDYFMERAASEGDTRTAAGLRDVAERVLDVLRRVPNATERDAFVPALTRLTGLDERLLREGLRRPAGGVRPAPSPGPGALVEGQARPPTEMASRLEMEALALLLRHPRAAAGVLDAERLPFRGATAAALARAALGVDGSAPGAPERGRDGDAIEGLLARLDAATAELARAVLAFADDPPLDPATAREAMRTCVVRLRGERLRERVADASALLRDAEREGNRDDVERIKQEINRLRAERAEMDRAMTEPATAGERR